jgi:hypothetical protein
MFHEMFLVQERAALTTAEKEQLGSPGPGE